MDKSMEGLVKVVSDARPDLGYICISKDDPELSKYKLYSETPEPKATEPKKTVKAPAKPTTTED